MNARERVAAERALTMREYRAVTKRNAEHEAHIEMLRALGRDVHEEGRFVISAKIYRSDRDERNHLLRLNVPRGAQVSEPVYSNGNYLFAWRRDRVEVSV